MKERWSCGSTNSDERWEVRRPDASSEKAVRNPLVAVVFPRVVAKRYGGESSSVEVDENDDDVEEEGRRESRSVSPLKSE